MRTVLVQKRPELFASLKPPRDGRAEMVYDSLTESGGLMPALRGAERIFIALASATVMVLALAQYRAAVQRLHPWPQPRIEFQWVREPGQTSVSNVPAIHAAPNRLRTVASETPRVPQVPDLVQQTRADVRSVERRLKVDLSRPLYDNFKLFLYVSKAESGPLAQHMYVFDKNRRGGLNFLHEWPVSTGREQVETDYANANVSTLTPSGYYELDPKRFYRNHESAEWHERMPYAMFLNWVKSGARTGLAIHAATGSDIAALGSRASAGCIRLAPEDARSLFMLVREHYRGPAPRFAIDPRTETTSNKGVLLRDRKGRIKFAQGYQVLLVIENYGGENVVAEVF